MRRSRSVVTAAAVVVAAFALQVLAYAAVVGMFEGGDATPLVEWLRHLPAPALVVLSVPGLPAIALTLLVGAVLESGLGLSIQQFGPALVTQGDGLFLVVAAALSLLAGRVFERARERERAGETRGLSERQ